MKPALESIQIDVTDPITEIDVAHTMEPEVLEKTNDETRQTEIQLNNTADYILTGELPSALTYEQCCSSKIWALNNIEKTIQARKCPNLLSIVHLICIFIVFSGVLGLIVKVVSDIDYLFFTGTVMGYVVGIISVVVILIAIAIPGTVLIKTILSCPELYD